MIGNAIRVTEVLMITTDPSQALSTTTIAANADKARFLVQYLDTALLPGFSTSTNRRRIVIMGNLPPGRGQSSRVDASSAVADRYRREDLRGT